MNSRELTIEEKKILLTALKMGLLSKAEVRKPDFNINLYTLKELPIFAFKANIKGFVNFMGQSMPEEEFTQIKAFYKELGNNQEIILI